MNNDPLGLGGFNSQALHSPAGPAVKASAPKQGLLGRIGSSLIQAPKYFVNTLGNETKLGVANLTNNQKAAAPARQQFLKSSGLGNNNNVGGAIKKLTGNTAQLAGALIAPEGEGLTSSAIAGARGGALIGGGSALSNNQNVLKGALEGAAGGAALAPAIPLAGKALGLGGKVVNAAATGRVGSATSDVADEASNLAPKPTVGQKLTNALVNKGQQEQANLGNYAVGQKVGPERLGTADSQRIAQTLQDNNITGATAKEGQAQIEEKLGQFNKARNGLYDVHNAPLTEEDKASLIQAVKDNITKTAGARTSATVQKMALGDGKNSLGFVNEAIDQGDLKGLGKYKTSLDKNIKNYNRNPASAEPGSQIAADVVRGPISDLLQSKIPGLSEIDAKATPLYTANDAMKVAAGRTAGISTSQGGIFGRVLGGETAEKAKGIYAKGLQKVGSSLGGEATSPSAAKAIDSAAVSPELTTEGTPLSTAKPAGAPSSILGSLTGGTNVARLGVAGALGNPPQSTAQAPISTSDNANDIPSAQTPTTQQSESENSPYPEENMLYDIERDPKNASTYESLFTLLNPKPTGPTTAQTTQSIAATNALSSLGTYNETLAKAGGPKSGILGSLENLGVKAHVLQGATPAAIQDIQSQKSILASEIVKAVTGSSRQPSPEAIQPYLDALPDVKDTPAEAKQKLSTISTYLNTILKDATSSSVDLSSLTSGAQ